MQLPDFSAAETLLTAGLAAGVSLLVAWTSSRVEHKKLEAERAAIERQIESTMSTRLFDLRLEVYPRAFEITAELGKAVLLGRRHTAAEMQKTASELRAWRQGTPALVMSDVAWAAYNQLLHAITRQPAADGEYTEQQISSIWAARLAFRGELRGDIGLLEFERRARSASATPSSAPPDTPGAGVHS